MYGDQIFYADQNLASEQQEIGFINSEAFKRFEILIEKWYKQQLIDNSQLRKYVLEVELDNIINFDLILAKLLKERPLEFHPIFEKCAKICYMKEFQKEEKDSPDFQVMIFSNENTIGLRDLRSKVLNQMVTVSGIIVNSTKVNQKLKKAVMQCKSCKLMKEIEVGAGMNGISLPRYCESNKGQNNQHDKCVMDPYIIIPSRSTIVDQQILKLQENPESVPRGEIPRTFQLCIDREITSKLITGTRLTLTGIYQLQSQNQNNYQLKVPFIQVLGYRSEQVGSRKLNAVFTEEDEEKFKELSKDNDIYEKISKNMASAIYGSEDIKKAISCLLFGGSSKVLPDQTRLRGDINILLIGDPSTAKSQLLKYVERVAPICIYTSGKGSSAAGLTASIIKDPTTNEFQLEGGAMVLADGGIVCIDEFDKMRVQDRVAIHEAMEQQTISIAKAGITTILNSRTSVLAAANPIFGRYDDKKSISDQIDLQTTILSRFDCIFVVRDPRDYNHDKMIAQHILDLHSLQNINQSNIHDIDLQFLRKYIHYAKIKCSPRLDQAASQALQNLYVEDRKKVKDNKDKKQHIPITVRQLEAIIRISEALAKMSLNDVVNIHHVTEAHRLFQVSTLNAISFGKEMRQEVSEDLKKLVDRIEDIIKKKVAINNKIQYNKLFEELNQRFSNNKAVEIAIQNLISDKTFTEVEKGRALLRKR